MEKKKERGIIFSGPMVRAILEGCKTQTRRIVRPHPDGMDPCYDKDFRKDFGGRKSPFGVAGDLLYVREAFAPPDGRGVVYRADELEHTEIPGGWKPSIHMPKKYTRIWLEITDVRVERVQKISPAEAIEEGAIEWFTRNGLSWKDSDKPYPVYAFQHLWDSINAKRMSWDKNPWVWVVTFRKVTR